MQYCYAATLTPLTLFTKIWLWPCVGKLAAGPPTRLMGEYMVGGGGGGGGATTAAAAVAVAVAVSPYLYALWYSGGGGGIDSTGGCGGNCG